VITPTVCSLELAAVVPSGCPLVAIPSDDPPEVAPVTPSVCPFEASVVTPSDCPSVVTPSDGPPDVPVVPPSDCPLEVPMIFCTSFCTLVRASVLTVNQNRTFRYELEASVDVVTVEDPAEI